MRVLFLTHRLPYAPNRGDRIRAHHLLRTLSDHAQIDLLSLVHDDEEAGHAGALQPWTESVHIARVHRTANLARSLPALAGGAPLTHVLLDSPAVLPAIDAICAHHRPDVVLAYCSGMAQYLFCPQLRAIPAVVDMVDVDSEKWTSMMKSGFVLKRWLYGREARQLADFEAHAARHAYATITINERERQALTALAPKARIESVPNGIDYEFFHPAAPPSGHADVVFCGVMNYPPNEQGILWMVEHVWPKVRARRPEARLAIVGSRPTAAVRRLQNPDMDVTVTGEVPDVRPYLWSAAVAIAPLWIARGLQNKVLEAVAAGLPCVVTPPVAAGLPDRVLSACPTASDADQFAAHILTVLDKTPAERRDLAARTDIKSLSWSAQLEPVLELLYEAAGVR